MDEYRSYFEEEEKPTPHPAGRWFGGLILGLILGGIIGFVIGSGNPASFFDDMSSSFAGEGVWIALTTIVIFGIAMLKTVVVRRSRGENVQATRWLVMMLLLAMVLAFGVLFFAGR